MKLGLPLYLVAIIALLGLGESFKLLDQESWGLGLNSLCSLQVYALSLPSSSPLEPEGTTAGAIDSRVVSHVAWPVTVKLQTRQGYFWCTALVSTYNGCPDKLDAFFWPQPPLYFTTNLYHLPLVPLLLCRTVLQSSQGLCGLSVCVRAWAV